MIPILFNILFFVIPLIFFKNTSELFEFNKIVALYSFTALIVSAWLIQSIRINKFIFKKTILDLPLLGYLVTLLLSTILSIDPRTSWLGYYSRFNGGLVSQICYALLYWAFVSNLDSKQALRTTYYILLATVIASILAVGERFGIFATCGLMGFGLNNSCWVQDVQSRVFSTLGQPNWLAALLVALLPIIFNLQFTIFNKFKIFNYLLFVLFFTTLLFTKSRSGLLAFGIEVIIFWCFIFWKERFKYFKEFIILFFASVIIYFVVNPPLATHNLPETVPNGPALETGGTESGTIRKYVWLGAWEVFKHYPILGTGPETFAFSFPMYKPAEHNLTSEWDFVYNKAHNEYLNMLANVGILGLVSYLILIAFSFKQIFNFQFLISNKFSIFNLSILTGYIAILVTNFFGFSVVPVSLLFFLFPAIATVQSTEYLVPSQRAKSNYIQKIAILLILCTLYFALSTIFKYWQADISYNKAKSLNRSGKQQEAIIEIEKALKFSPNEAVYNYEKAISDGTPETAFNALNLSKYNQNMRKILINNLVKNSDKNPEYLLMAEEVIKDGIKISPNDPKLSYQLGILQLRANKLVQSVDNFINAILLKSNYKEARYALGATYVDIGENDKAKVELEYILKNIDPNDELTKKYLDKII